MIDNNEDRSSGKLTLGRRVTLLEQWQLDHAKTLSELIKATSEQRQEITKLTEWKLEQIINEAKQSERDKTLESRLLRIEKSIEDGVGSIKASFSKAFWIAAGTIIPAAVAGLGIVIIYGTKIATLGS